MRYREAARALAALGCFELARKSSGSHRKWHDPPTGSVATLPDWGSRDLKVGTVRAGELAVDEAVAKLDRALALVDSLVPVEELAKESLVAAADAGHPVYDLAYAVLARREGATVVTADRGFTEALRELRSPVLCVTPEEAPRTRGRRPRRPAR